MMTQTQEHSGRLIAICGIDGSGKNTQTGLLADRAAAEGWTVRQVSFPRYGESFFGDLISRYLRGEFAQKAGDVSPYLAALPYACDRWEASAQLGAWLQEGCLVLCNRYVPANMAHQGAKLQDEQARQEFLQWVDRLEYGTFGLPRPRLHLLLDVPTEVSAGLLRERDAREGKQAGHDIHERDRAYLDATARVYRQLAQSEPCVWRIVPCVEHGALLPPSRIADRVWAEVRSILYNDE